MQTQEFINMLNRADQGDVEAMVLVADCCTKGLYTDKDDVMGQKYYTLAADSGSVPAMLMAGLGYLHGTGIEKNKKLAVKYIKKAADLGHGYAQYLMGVLYMNGDVGFFNKKQNAYKYFLKAAENGNAEAQLEVGDAMYTGEGLAQNLEKSIFWLCCAYLHGDKNLEVSQNAKKRLDFFVENGVPGGVNRIKKTIVEIKGKHRDLIQQ